MAEFRAEKVVASLPDELTPDTVYYVRTGEGFDIYVSDATGAAAHTLNPPAREGSGDGGFDLTEAADIAYAFIIGLSEHDGQLLENWLAQSDNTAAFNLYVVESSQRSDDVINIYGPMKAIADSPTAVANMLFSQSVRGKIATSTSASEAIARSSVAMDLVVTSYSVMDDLFASETFVEAMLISEVALNTAAANELAKKRLVASAIARAVIARSPVAFMRFIAALAGLDYELYADFQEVLTNEDAMTAIATSADAMTVLISGGLPQTVDNANLSHGGDRVTFTRRSQRNNPGSFVELAVKIDFTHFSKLHIKARSDTFGDTATRMAALLYIGSDRVLELSGSNNVFENREVDLTGIGGHLTVRLGFSSTNFGEGSPYTVDFGRFYLE